MHTDGGDGAGTLENSLTVSYEIRHMHTHCITKLGISPRAMTTCPHKESHSNVPSNLICNSWEQSKCPLHEVWFAHADRGIQ